MYKIGLVEDEKNLNSLVKNYLEKEGYEVITFFNGEDVLNYEDLLKVQLSKSIINVSSLFTKMFPAYKSLCIIP